MGSNDGKCFWPELLICFEKLMNIKCNGHFSLKHERIQRNLNAIVIHSSNTNLHIYIVHVHVGIIVIAGAYERREAARRSVKLQYPSVVESHF